MRTSLKHVAIAVTAALVGSGVGIAAAAGDVTISADDTIVGCVDRDTRAVRIVERARQCRDTEDVVRWNQTGPVGPEGPTGPQGPVGPAGPAGVDGRTIGYFGLQPTSPAPTPLRESRLTTIVTVDDVPAGTYQGTVSSIVTTDGLPKGIDVNVYCRVIDPTTKPSRTVSFFAMPNRWATMSAAVQFRVDTDGSTVKLRCKGDPATLVDTRLEFVQVAN